MDYTPPDSSVHGIPQARLEWVAISFSRGSSPLRDPIQVSWIAGDLLHHKQILYGLSHREAPQTSLGACFSATHTVGQDCYPQKGQQRGCQQSLHPRGSTRPVCGHISGLSLFQVQSSKWENTVFKMK